MLPGQEEAAQIAVARVKAARHGPSWSESALPSLWSSRSAEPSSSLQDANGPSDGVGGGGSRSTSKERRWWAKAAQERRGYVGPNRVRGAASDLYDLHDALDEDWETKVVGVSSKLLPQLETPGLNDDQFDDGLDRQDSPIEAGVPDRRRFIGGCVGSKGVLPSFLNEALDDDRLSSGSEASSASMSARIGTAQTLTSNLASNDPSPTAGVLGSRGPLSSRGPAHHMRSAGHPKSGAATLGSLPGFGGAPKKTSATLGSLPDISECSRLDKIAMFKKKFKFDSFQSLPENSLEDLDPDCPTPAARSLAAKDASSPNFCSSNSVAAKDQSFPNVATSSVVAKDTSRSCTTPISPTHLEKLVSQPRVATGWGHSLTEGHLPFAPLPRRPQRPSGDSSRAPPRRRFLLSAGSSNPKDEEDQREEKKPDFAGVGFSKKLDEDSDSSDDCLSADDDDRGFARAHAEAAAQRIQDRTRFRTVDSDLCGSDDAGDNGDVPAFTMRIHPAPLMFGRSAVSKETDEIACNRQEAEAAASDEEDIELDSGSQDAATERSSTEQQEGFASASRDLERRIGPVSLMPRMPEFPKRRGQNPRRFVQASSEASEASEELMGVTMSLPWNDTHELR